ncbi:MAG: TauD/TfdA family dioxygenase, partial [Hyphomicrobiales bacterium]|nr:TauD/TfdA family dioxygenase [Hyphomicrobiales bacterium]
RFTGVQIDGIDLSQPLDTATAGEIYKLFADHCVILFRDQTLTQEQLVSATANFGTVAEYARPADLRSDTQKQTPPQIMLITNIRKDGKPIGALPDGEMWFHHDMIHASLPHKATMLYSVQIPDHGGNTCFSNLFAAYDALPERLRDRLEGRMAVNAFNYGSRFKGDPEGLARRAESIHPAVVVHPDNGRKALYVDRLMTQSIVGMDEQESDALLEEVFDFIEREEFLYDHEWRKGDVLMWDNRSSIHARRDFPADQVRLMWRTTLEAEQPPRYS